MDSDQDNEEAAWKPLIGVSTVQKSTANETRTAKLSPFRANTTFSDHRQ
jgi:hypothetical protein